MANPHRSINDLLAQNSSQGGMARSIHGSSAATTAANSTSGYLTGLRYPQTFTMPALGSGVTNAWMTNCGMYSPVGWFQVLAIEVPMGTLTVSGNSFADGSAMPTRTIYKGSSSVLPSIMPMCVVTTTLTATTPVLTITYKNQAGTAGQTATLTLPTNTLANTAFQIVPHLASGDSGIQDISGLSISTGSAGVIKIFGLMPLSVKTVQGGTTGNGAFAQQILTSPFPRYPITGSDILAFYRFGSTTTGMGVASFFIEAET